MAGGWRKVFCALVLSAIVLIALHTHASFDPLDDQPLASGHHCLLCITAHLPQAVSSGTVAPLPPSTAADTLSLATMESAREPKLAFSLYMRPPPAL